MLYEQKVTHSNKKLRYNSLEKFKYKWIIEMGRI